MNALPRLPLMMLCWLTCSAPLLAATIESYHSALWYDPARDGEGFVLEVYADDHALLTWYTYDDQGRQRWLTGFGNLVIDAEGNESLHFPDMLAPRGGRFGPGFDPAQVQRLRVGEISLRFDDCWRGSVDYAVFGQTGTLDLHRLTRTMGATCGPVHGTTGEPVQAYAGQSGAWYDPAHDGEGWLLQWLAEGEAVVTWFTYTPQGEPYWLIGTGTMEDGTIVFPQMQSTRGARFGDAFDPDDVERIDWGRLELAIDCDAGTVRYASTIPGFGSGGLDDVIHLSRLAQPPCPWVAPKLTDLYDITYTELPISPGNPLQPNVIRVYDMADDGTVVGTRYSDPQHQGEEIVRLRAGDDTWELLAPESYLRAEIRITPDGRKLYGDRGTDLMRWSEQDGWTSVPGLVAPDALSITGASADRSRILGWSAIYDQDDTAGFYWLWSAERGQEIIPVWEGEVRVLRPHTASNNGRFVYGSGIRFVDGVSRMIAKHWEVGDEPPIIMRDHLGVELSTVSTCSSDGSVAFGNDQVTPDPAHPHFRQPWYWRRDGGFDYLGSADGAFLPLYYSYGIAATTDDGSLAVGGMATGPATSEALIWTQTTGLLSVGDLLEELDLGEPWSTRWAIKVSTDGRLILLRGSVFQQHAMDLSKAALLRLTPKRISDPK